jgi:pimeloyl-ACP methyl ester carboxylesterase
MREEPLQFGQDRRLLGILTVPGVPASNGHKLPIFVFLSAGLLHRVGPYRLHVRLARELAKMGFTSLRVDLAGTGDSAPRSGLTNEQSVAADFADILNILDSHQGPSSLVLAGLCSGADNAMRLTLNEPRVVGMLLLDPICYADRGPTGFKARAIVSKYADPGRYRDWVKRRYDTLVRGREEAPPDPLDVDPLISRDCLTREQMPAVFEAIRARNGRVLSIFTYGALRYYSRQGQLGRALGVKDYREFCTELFWPNTDHTYRLELHRQRLIDEIKAWACNFIPAVAASPALDVASAPTILLGAHQSS